MAYNKTKIISCTSFKGGSGRTVSMANIAFQLAKEHKVGCIDFDIEAGGLHYVFGTGSILDKLSIQHVLMDEEDYTLFTEGQKPDFDNKETFIDRLCINIRETQCDAAYSPDLGGELYLIQAELNAGLTSMVDTSRMAFHRFNRLLDNFSNFLNLDYILIDCRSGISNFGLPGLAFCDVALFFLRWGTQHRNGTRELLNWYSDWLRRGDLSTKIFLIPSTINPAITSENNIATFYSDCQQYNVVGYKVLPEVEHLKSGDKVITSGAEQIPYKSLANTIAELMTNTIE